MTTIEAARKLGEAIQQDERFIRYAKARLENDKDKDLQDKIGEFNTIRMNLERESSAEKQDEAKIHELNEKLRASYAGIMSTPSMVEFNAAKTDLDTVLNEVNSVIMQCVDGADPATVEPEKHECSGSCESCGGCH